MLVTRTLTQKGRDQDSHWSTRTMAAETGLSQSSVSRIWRAFGLKPHVVTNRKLRRSAHRSVTELETDIRKWISEWNKDPKPFTWTKSADEILETLAEYCQRITGPGTPAR